MSRQKHRSAEEMRASLLSRTTKTEAGCLLWTGALATGGYGIVRWNGRLFQPHRLAWEFAHGTPIPPGLDAMHSCDTPACINPDHIRPGTRSENMQDCIRKGRRSQRRP